jgi:hypothetical protein
MTSKSNHIKINKEFIELYDIVESDFKIEDCYGQANEILLRNTVIDKESGFNKYRKIQKMRITTIYPKF